MSKANRNKSNGRTEGRGTIYEKLAAVDNLAFGCYPVGREDMSTDSLEFASFAKPTDLLVSKWYPGYRVADLSGKFADEAIGLLLASALEADGALESFRVVLSDPIVPIEVITKLLPRAGIPVKGRSYMMSEGKIADVVKATLTSRYPSMGEAVITAYSYAITQVLNAKRLVLMNLEKRVVFTDASFTVDATTLRRIVLVESLRDVFSETRIHQETKDLDMDATPDLIGETIGRMFRKMSFSIPEVSLRLMELETVAKLVAFFHLDQQKVPMQLRAHPSLQALASIANFVVMLDGQSTVRLEYPAEAVSEAKDACNNVLTMIQSARAIESIPLSRFPEYFGEAPASSPDGIRRGAVLFKVLGQTSKMEIADCRVVSEGIDAALLAAEYVPVSGIAGPITGSILTTEAASGLANVVADEIALSSSDVFVEPVLVTMQVTDVDLKLLAMAKAQIVSFSKINTAVAGALNLLYGVQVADSWRMNVSAATPTLAFFTKPEAVILYCSGMQSTLPTSLPSRGQTFGLQLANDTVFLGNVDDFLVKNVEVPFVVEVPLTTGAGIISLKLTLLVLGNLLGYNPKSYPDRGTAFYAAVREPGVDEELSLLLEVAMAYAASGGDILADKAQSWLVDHLAPAMMHPSISVAAERAVNAATLEAGLDARSLAPQFKDLYVRAYFGFLLAVLARFDKIPARMAADILPLVPVSHLTLKSQLTLASLPAGLGANAFTK